MNESDLINERTTLEQRNRKKNQLRFTSSNIFIVTFGINILLATGNISSKKNLVKQNQFILN